MTNLIYSHQLFIVTCLLKSVTDELAPQVVVLKPYSTKWYVELPV